MSGQPDALVSAQLEMICYFYMCNYHTEPRRVIAVVLELFCETVMDPESGIAVFSHSFKECRTSLEVMQHCAP